MYASRSKLRGIIVGRRQIHLEVERKFSRLRHRPFLYDSGSPAFDSLAYLGRSSFTDVYYDRDELLSKSGMWLRRRNEQWQAKIRVTRDTKVGNQYDYINSRFKEVVGHDEVWKYLAQVRMISSDYQDEHIPDHDLEPQFDPYCHPHISGRPLPEVFGLNEIARITTTRETWLADGTFKIVLDQADFGHVVGEVELECETDNESAQEDITEKMDDRIERFMRRYSWAFDTHSVNGSNLPTGTSAEPKTEPRIMGKLSAYFNMMAQKDHAAERRTKKNCSAFVKPDRRTK